LSYTPKRFTEKAETFFKKPEAFFQAACDRLNGYWEGRFDVVILENP